MLSLTSHGCVPTVNDTGRLEILDVENGTIKVSAPGDWATVTVHAPGQPG